MMPWSQRLASLRRRTRTLQLTRGAAERQSFGGCYRRPCGSERGRRADAFRRWTALPERWTWPVEAAAPGSMAAMTALCLTPSVAAAKNGAFRASECMIYDWAEDTVFPDVPQVSAA